MESWNFENWFNSGCEKKEFPSIPKDQVEQRRFLTTLTQTMLNDHASQLENAITKLPLIIGNKINCEIITEVLEQASSLEKDPLKAVLLGELNLDFLILHEKWEESIQKAGKLLEIARANNLQEEITILLNYRGVCFYRLARYPEAKIDLHESLRLATEQKNDRRRGRASINLGLVYKDTGQLETAAGHYKLALKIAREQKDFQTVLACYINIGNIYRELNRWQDSFAALESGIELARETGDLKEEMRGRLNLGVLLLEEGKDLERAANLFKQVIVEAEQSEAEKLLILARSNLGLALVRLNRPQEALKELEIALSLATRAGDIETIWRANANLARAYRALCMHEKAEPHFQSAIFNFSKLRNTLKSDRDRSEFQRNLQTLCNEYVSYGLQVHGPETAFARLALNKGNLAGFVDSSMRKSEEAVVPAVKRRLKNLKNTVVLDYFFDDGKLLIFTCNSNKVDVHESSYDEAAIKALIEEFYAENNLFIASREFREANSSKSAKPSKSLTELWHALIEPVTAHIENFNHLAIVPSGILFHVPFGALVNSRNKYLIEKCSYSILPSSNFLTKKVPGSIDENSKIAVIIGEGSGLVHIESELEGLKAVFKERLRVINAGEYKEFNAISLLDELSREVEVIHFLGHGEFDISDPYSSCLMLPGGAKIVLSDFDSAKLDLGKIKLVSLSACETGRVKVMTADEIIGISRGFLMSGAGCVIASLWKVPDDTTAKMIPRLYLELLNGKAVSEALRSASCLILGENRINPYFFAGFQIYGMGGGTSEKTKKNRKKPG